MTVERCRLCKGNKARVTQEKTGFITKTICPECNGKGFLFSKDKGGEH